MSSLLAGADVSADDRGADNTLPQIKARIDMAMALARSCGFQRAEAIAYVQKAVQECRADCVLPVATEALIYMASVAQDLAEDPGVPGWPALERHWPARKSNTARRTPTTHSCRTTATRKTVYPREFVFEPHWLGMSLTGARFVSCAGGGHVSPVA